MSDFSHLEIGGFVGEPTVGEIEELELLVGAPLPADFVDFLRVANGGYLDYQIELGDGENRELFSFNTFFSTRQPEESTPHFYRRYLFKDEIASIRRSLAMPEGILPLAEDGGGSLLYLDLRDRFEGVYALIEPMPGWTGFKLAGRVKVAKSMTDYVSQLRALEPEDEDSSE